MHNFMRKNYQVLRSLLLKIKYHSLYSLRHGVKKCFIGELKLVQKVQVLVDRWRKGASDSACLN